MKSKLVPKANKKSIYFKNARYYDLLHHLQTLWADNYHRNETINLAKKYVAEPINLLEIGCGTGIFTKKVKREFQNSKFYCFDRSIDMIKVGKVKSQTNNVLLADLLYPPFADNTFDLILGTYVLGGIKLEPNYILKLNNLLKKNGKFCICEMTEPGEKVMNIFIHLHRLIVEPFINKIWGFVNINKDMILRDGTFKLLEEKYYKNRLLGSTTIFCFEKSEQFIG